MSKEHLREKLSDIRFNEHTIEYEQDEDGKNKSWYLRVPKKDTFGIKYMIIPGWKQNITVVDGDYGRWTFFREFHPSSNGYVSEHYWNEKCETNSEQKVMKYDHDGTYKYIEKMIEAPDEYGVDEKYVDELTGCLDELEDECSAIQALNYIKSWDDGAPLQYDTAPWLKIIYDGFNEICRRYEIAEELIETGGYGNLLIYPLMKKTKPAEEFSVADELRIERIRFIELYRFEVAPTPEEIFNMASYLGVKIHE